VVEAVGPGSGRLRRGDHVVLSFDSCGQCQNCQGGLPSHCAEFVARNVSEVRPDGTTPMTDAHGVPVSARFFGQSSFASHAIATERSAVKIDQAIPLEIAGPLGCSVQTGAGTVMRTLDLRPGSSIAVFGAGAVGLAAVIAARVREAAAIVAVDINPARLELARELGATHTADGRSPEVVAEVTAAAGGGVTYSFDTSGAEAVMAAAVEVLRPGGPPPWRPASALPSRRPRCCSAAR
jgi:aryl-alcohol dehydrogenase